MGSAIWLSLSASVGLRLCRDDVRVRFRRRSASPRRWGCGFWMPEVELVRWGAMVCGAVPVVEEEEEEE